MTIGTGQGKTAMIWMIAIALQNKTGASKILIVTPNEAMKQQFRGYFPPGIVPNGIKVTDEPNFQ
jgi:ribose 5-phosphate isomerase